VKSRGGRSKSTCRRHGRESRRRGGLGSGATSNFMLGGAHILPPCYPIRSRPLPLPTFLSLPSLCPFPALPLPSLSPSLVSLPFNLSLAFPSPSSLSSSPPLPAAKRPPHIQLGGLGERCELPQRVRAEPGRQTNFGAFCS
jgi:hypothetical protein